MEKESKKEETRAMAATNAPAAHTRVYMYGAPSKRVNRL